jgi:hypothetical protein
MNGRTYEHSGRLGTGPLLVPLIAVPATLLLGLVYGYADAYCPIAGWVSILIVGAYTAAVSCAVGAAGTFGKVRNSGFLALSGAAAGLLALYAGWAAFDAAILGRGAPPSEPGPGYLELLAHPTVVMRIASAIAEHGWYSIAGATPSGLALWLLWGVEAVVIVGGTAAIAGSWQSDTVFCEACDQWCDDAERRPLLALPEGGVEALGPAVEGKPDGLALLERLAASAPSATTVLRVDLKRCPGCNTSDAVRLRLLTHGLDKNGKKTTETKDLSPWLLVDRPASGRLEALGGANAAA